MNKLITLALCCAISPIAFGSTLVTDNYIVSIESNCAEGNVTCDDVTDTGKSKSTGNTITLKGTTLHRMCSDRVTPCQFIGYEFHNGNVTYSVKETGVLSVIQNGKLLLKENGKWEW